MDQIISLVQNFEKDFEEYICFQFRFIFVCITGIFKMNDLNRLLSTKSPIEFVFS